MSFPANSTNSPLRSHDCLTQKQAEAFSAWMDIQLAKLEIAFADFTTPLSLRRPWHLTRGGGSLIDERTD
jgi:hypothetical protein